MIGSGKTTIGKALAAGLNLPFYDLDDEMDNILGYSFHDLVKNQGWLAFRELEYSICKNFARQKEGIICLGGGTVRYEWNMDVIRGTGLVILLTADLDVLIERVRTADRPRVNPDSSLEDDIRLIWESHREKYIGAAQVRYHTDRKSLDEEVKEIKKIVIDWKNDPARFDASEGPIVYG
jgi:shikimate kinase